MTVFEVLCEARAGGPRLGRLHTAHGPVDTPAFMPVGTNATVRALTPEEVAETGAQMILANAFHLYLRPGPELIERAGGLHAFMAWPGPIMTDSGGYQVFSLAKMRHVDDDGVTFRSPVDGSTHRFTPERVVEIQRRLGADILMPLDHLLGYPHAPGEDRAAMERTLRWAERARAYHARDGGGALFGIVQGGFAPALRAEAARRTAALDFPGYAIGGLSVGEPAALMYELLEIVVAELPLGRPRYLMGVGGVPGLLEGIGRGVDLFDCALPTRVARTGVVFTSTGRLNLRNAAYRTDLTPPDPGCPCRVCARTTRAYLRHLFTADEMLGPRLATYHNLFFLERLVQQARAAIAAGAYERWRAEVLARYRDAW
ncbi:MAG: tRNA guanosine(34) transglycosylase Tgt [Armatimonadota bacterium]|nr:tRNA guanosine(34) transglycosylase Tgt [Armatimonadota bacterium]MDR7533358.1 tRNA guanosine(34) transglycosylase Tgt [Armatimonadota bacterium]MDR7536478.1 tRNA guanosine(34) transglycosylase Tgt [Armatimonadota bacterium]